uniref:Auxin response factor 6 n=1 Tax=Solanum tuberosum TaxID=4113 RepID=M1CBA9_SOLTU
METAADLDAKTNQHYSCDLEKERGSSRSREKEREKRRDKDRMERFLVQIAVSTNKDSVGWMGSWDESTAGERQPRVLLWEIEPLTTFLMYPSPFSLRLKRPWSIKWCYDY